MWGIDDKPFASRTFIGERRGAGYFVSESSLSKKASSLFASERKEKKMREMSVFVIMVIVAVGILVSPQKASSA